MKKVIVEISLRDTRKAYSRMEGYNFITRNGKWTSSNVYESNEFDADDEDEMNVLEDLQDTIENILSDCEYEINEVEI
jgi:hypothetical protein